MTDINSNKLDESANEIVDKLKLAIKNENREDSLVVLDHLNNHVQTVRIKNNMINNKDYEPTRFLQEELQELVNKMVALGLIKPDEQDNQLALLNKYNDLQTIKGEACIISLWNQVDIATANCQDNKWKNVPVRDAKAVQKEKNANKMITALGKEQYKKLCAELQSEHKNFVENFKEEQSRLDK